MSAAMLAAAPVAARSEHSGTMGGSEAGVTAYGDAEFFGSAHELPLARPIVGMWPTPTDRGYWLVAGDGGIFSFGDARFAGSTGGMILNQPVVNMAGDPAGRGYWTVASDGGVFSFGVPFHGSMGGIALNQPVVAMAPSATGDGYWLVASDGGVFSFGDARFAGSTGGMTLNRPVTGMAADPDGGGYWLVALDGGVFSFDAEFHGSAVGSLRRGDHAVGIAAAPDGDGYWIATRQGDVFAFGSAAQLGDARGSDLDTVAITPTSTGAGYWLAHAPLPPDVVVSSFTTPLVPGQSRNTNIHLAADYIDGAVINPGATFSLNEGIGERTAARGFVRNGFIDEGDVISVVGGGVSQMGTTFLNAAWFAGIELVEFRPHTIYFERYPMCREATLAWGILDVVVVNDSPYPITVSTSHTPSSVTVSFISKPWATVESWIGEPFNVEGPGGAFSVRCGRTVTYPDGDTSSDAYFWRYNSGFPG